MLPVLCWAGCSLHRRDNWSLFGEEGKETRKVYKTIFLWGWIIS